MALLFSIRSCISAGWTELWNQAQRKRHRALCRRLGNWGHFTVASAHIELCGDALDDRLVYWSGGVGFLRWFAISWMFFADFGVAQHSIRTASLIFMLGLIPLRSRLFQRWL
ncbi:unnamed protein product [Prorocentrum cordatum]|uniref:Mannosyltransferase n=1 Tax=Prorocentrum cordatum TaxID=2364126 RepID=A0ABN9WQS8_9DINO|nr:unnamed protein product [Polarella glacialis]